MDESKVREIVNVNVDGMCCALALQDWRIDIEYTHCDRATGTCTPEPVQRLATIEIDPAKCEDEGGVLGVLRHELLHIFTADFETYRKAVAQLVPDSTFNAIDEFFRFAVESVVHHLERAFDLGLKIDMRQFCEPSEHPPPRDAGQP